MLGEKTSLSGAETREPEQPTGDNIVATASVTSPGIAPYNMIISDKRDEDLDGVPPDQVIFARPEWGSVAMAAMAASFDAGVPAAMAAANATLFWTLEKNGDFSISNGGGTLAEYFLEKIGLLDANGHKKDGDDSDAWDDYREIGERREEERREKEWDKTEYDFGGMQMSGEEIDALVDFIRDPAQRQRLIERRAREKGVSTQQATKDVDSAARYAELFKKVKMGTATQEETQEYERLKADPNVIETVKMAQDAKSEAFHEPAPTSRMSSDQTASASSRANDLDRPFPQAPPVQEHFEEAKLATVPLDGPKPLVAPTSQQVASVAPPPQVAPSGFDV